MLRRGRLSGGVVWGLALAAAAASVLLCSARDARAGEHDDCDEPEPPHAGLAQGETKLSLGLEYATTGDDHGDGHAVRINGEFEHMLRNRWGLVGSTALPVAGTWVASSSMGMRLHALPRSAVDPFVGVGAGFAWIHPPTFAADVVPLIGMRVGLALYSTGAYFVQVDAGYDFVRYSHGGVGFDLGGFVATARSGFYF